MTKVLTTDEGAPEVTLVTTQGQLRTVPMDMSGALPSVLPPLGFGVLYVDPSNITGNASDSNPPGPFPLAPILTTDHASSLWLFKNINANLEVVYLSDDPTTQSLFMGPMTVVSNGASVRVRGTQQTLVAGLTVDASTNMFPLTNTRATIQSGVFDFAPHRRRLVVVTAGPALGLTAWLPAAAVAGVLGVLSAPVAHPLVQGAIGNGNVFDIRRGSFVRVAYFGPTPSDPQIGGVSFEDFTFQPLPGGTVSAFNDFGFFSATKFLRCRFLSAFCGFTTGVGFTFENCYTESVLSGEVIVGFSAGVLEGEVAALEVALDTDAYVTGHGITVAPNSVEILFVSALAGAGAQWWDCTNPDGALYLETTSQSAGAPNARFAGTARLWGAANIGPGIGLGPGARLTISAADVPTITGANGDFAFKLPPAGAVVQQARSWDNALGQYTGEFVTLWGNWTNPAQLNFNAHSLQSDAHLIGV
jgi:hypothetical protein